MKWDRRRQRQKGAKGGLPTVVLCIGAAGSQSASKRRLALRPSSLESRLRNKRCPPEIREASISTAARATNAPSAGREKRFPARGVLAHCRSPLDPWTPTRFHLHVANSIEMAGIHVGGSERESEGGNSTWEMMCENPYQPAIS